jgi:phosphomannomutase
VRGRPTSPLAFGTSGLRGLVTDITDLEAYVNTRGFLDYLRDSGDAPPKTPVALAGDLRPSTHGPERSILGAVARAISDAGHSVIFCGLIPTPALMAYAMVNGWPSIMVTGSHIPFDRNGIKFNKSSGEVLKDEEPAILRAVERVREIEYQTAADESQFDDRGMFRARSTLPPESTAARDFYLQRYVNFFPPGALAGMRVAVYEHSAVGAQILGEILSILGAEVFPFGRSIEFVAIDTEAMSRERLAQLESLVGELCRRLGNVHALVSTDGDSDRPLVLDVAPGGETRFVPGDVLGILVADYLGVDALAVPITVTDALERHLAGRDVQVVRTRIGSPYVIAASQSLKGRKCVGWEANGGFLTFSDIDRNGRKLASLPTRDAALPILSLLHAANERRIRVDGLLEGLPRRFSASGLLDGISPDEGLTLYAHLGAGSAESMAPTARVSSTMAHHFGAERGLGKLTRLDFLDGVRMTFENGDVAHIRQSGNAPQLRAYALSDTAERAHSIVADLIREPDGILRGLLAEATERRFVNAVRSNIEATNALFTTGHPPAVIGTVSGSAAAQRFWQRLLDEAEASFRARRALSFHEDLPVNQAFGLLLLWQRLREHVGPGDGALIAFVFGDGSRATPFTEAEHGQKSAMASFALDSARPEPRFITIAELALRYFATVETFLRRSGFDGLVVKWGDEIQIPTRDLTGSDSRFRDADVVRFVSMQPMTAETAANKDWVGVDPLGRVTAFVPRRPIEQMRALAERGLLELRGERLWGGVNLGSVAVSRLLLDALLEEFRADVNDPSAERTRRPDLDPQLFTALTIASIPEPGSSAEAFAEACRESPAIAELHRNLPNTLARLRRVLERFEARHGRAVRIVALDFGEQYWGDIGQHRAIFDFYMALNDSVAPAAVARALAGLPEERDPDGNIIGRDTHFGRARVRNSVLVGCEVEEGEVLDSVLIGTRARKVTARGAFDVSSVVTELTLAERAGSYKLVSEDPVVVDRGMRATTLSLPGRTTLMTVAEDTDLRDRAATYDVPVHGNAISFREAHALMLETDPAEVETRRAPLIAKILAKREK